MRIACKTSVLTLIFRSLKRDDVTLSNRRVVQILRVCWAHWWIILSHLDYLARADKIWLGWLHWAFLCTVVIDSFYLIRSNDEPTTSARAFGLASVAQDLNIVGVDSHTLALFMNSLISHVWIWCCIFSTLMPLVGILLVIMLLFLRERLDVLILFYESDLVLDNFRLIIMHLLIRHTPFTLFLAALNHHGNWRLNTTRTQFLTSVTPNHKGRIIVRESSDLLYFMSRQMDPTFSRKEIFSCSCFSLITCSFLSFSSSSFCPFIYVVKLSFSLRCISSLILISCSY